MASPATKVAFLVAGCVHMVGDYAVLPDHHSRGEVSSMNRDPQTTPKTAQEINGMIRLRRAGTSLAVIGARYGISKQGVADLLKRHGSPDLDVQALNARRQQKLRPCAKCGQPTKNQKYCSRRCARLAQSPAESLFAYMDRLCVENLSREEMLRRLQEAGYHVSTLASLKKRFTEMNRFKFGLTISRGEEYKKHHG